MTTDIDQRIAQFENMAAADPDNDMAHFSLGNAYAQAERWADAAASYKRCTDLNNAMTKAYQLGGEALIKAGDEDAAREFLRVGYVEAAQRGDRLPQEAMKEMLESLGAEVPEVNEAPPQELEGAGEGGGFRCQRTGRMGTQLPDPPFRGPLGEYIQRNISAETWREWIGQGTKVINELRLDLSRESDARLYDQHMIEFLGLEEAQRAIDEGREPPE
jgi:Fe-S cluster biosynthesis and repair protein YggX